MATRQYTITAPEEFLDGLEKILEGKNIQEDIIMKTPNRQDYAEIVGEVLAFRNKLDTLDSSYDRQYLLEIFDKHFNDRLWQAT